MLVEFVDWPAVMINDATYSPYQILIGSHSPKSYHVLKQEHLGSCNLYVSDDMVEYGSTVLGVFEPLSFA